MINITEQRDNSTTWQDGFLRIFPDIQQRLQHAFRTLDPESCEDAREDAIVHCLLAYIRLFEQGRVEAVTPSSLTWYAVLQVRQGRQAGSRMNAREPLSRYAQIRKKLRIERLQPYGDSHDMWIDSLVEDRRASVADQVATKLDFRAWMATLSRRTGEIARALAYGFTTSEVARKHNLSASRVSQLRRRLKDSWAEFQGESAAVK